MLLGEGSTNKKDDSLVNLAVENTDKPDESQNNNVDNITDNTTKFLSNFEGNQKKIVEDCLQEIRNDAQLSQLKSGLEKILESSNSDEFTNKIKKELEDGINVGFDEESLKILLQSIITESISEFKIGSEPIIEGAGNQMNKKTEEAAQEKVIRDQNEEKAVQNEEVLRGNEKEENKIVDIKKMTDKLNENLRERENLLQGRPDIDKNTREEAEKIKNELSEETKNQLKEKGYDDQFINDYILVRVTLNEIKKDSSFDRNAVDQFESKVNELSNWDIILKNIDNACKTPDTRLSSFDKDNIAQTRTELFHDKVGNKDLIEVKEINMESKSHTEKYNQMFSEMKDDDLFIKYGKFLTGNLREFCNQYQNNQKIKEKFSELKENRNLFDDKGNLLQNAKIKDNPDIPDEDKILLRNYEVMRNETLNIKNNFDTKTKDMIEELCILSQIKGMYMCMGEGENFNLNKAKEIESKDGILTLRGHIDGIDFAIRQDTTKEEPLQTSSKLAKENSSKDDTDKKERFLIGGDKNFVYSNYILPTQNQIFDTITETVMSDNSLVNSDNQENYIENLQKNIMGNIDKKYEKTKYVHNYMKEQVQGEKIIDKTISFVEKLDKDSNLDLSVINSNPKLYDFFNLMDFNIKYSTGVEKEKFYKIMDKIDRMADLTQNNSSNGELANHRNNFAKYLTGASLDNTRKILNGNVVEGESNEYAFDLFKKYINESDGRNKGELHMINFNQMYQDLNNVEIKQKEQNDIAKNKEDLKELDEKMLAAYD